MAMNVSPWHDFVWCERHLHILAGRERVPTIKPLRYNSIQRKLNGILVEELKKPIRLIILKFRQGGVSTWTESVIYGRCRRVPNQAALILAHDPVGTEHIYQMFRRFHEHEIRQLPTRHLHQRGLAFAPPHNSQVTIQTAAKMFAGTSMTLQLAHLSELAKWPFPDETMLSLLQTMPATPGTFAVIESTAWGAGGYFHSQWLEAKEGANQWRPVFLPWFDAEEYVMDVALVDMGGLGTEERYNYYEGEEVDLQKAHLLTERQMAWRRWAIDNNCRGDVLRFHQEYPSDDGEAFIASGSPRFFVSVLRRWYEQSEDPIFVGVTPLVIEGRQASTNLVKDGGGWLSIWRHPRPGNRYVVGADCAGVDAGGDHNAAVVIDTSTLPWEVVATVHGIRGADLYARALANVGYLFNEALMAVEVNGIGEACQSHLRHWYPERSIYHRLPIDRATRMPTERIGWYTGHITRHNLIECLDAAIRDEMIAVKDEATILELLNFQRVPGQRNGEAKPGTHDDRVFALGIAIQAASYRVSSEYSHFDEGRHVRGTAPLALRRA